MVKKEIRGKRLFVLDTNVLMHDPTALFRFQEHDIYLPMVVLEELDRSKKGVSEVARNVRQVSRFVDELMADATHAEIAKGLPLVSESLAESAFGSSGRLFFQTRAMPVSLPDSLPGNTPDNTILGTALALQQERPDVDVTLVSKDINLRIKAAVSASTRRTTTTTRCWTTSTCSTADAANSTPTSGNSTASAWTPGRKAVAPSTACTGRW